MREKHSRTLAKTFSWRILASLTTMLLVWLFSGNFGIAITVGVVEAIVKLIIYYFHERLWNYTSWGLGPGKRKIKYLTKTSHKGKTNDKDKRKNKSKNKNKTKNKNKNSHKGKTGHKDKTNNNDKRKNKSKNKNTNRDKDTSKNKNNSEVKNKQTRTYKKESKVSSTKKK